MAEMTARDAKLVQYLNDAYGKEKELETSLQAHIGMASRKPYKNRLKDHLKETKNHARLVERRIKKLGGASTLQTVATKGGEAVSRGVALAKGPLHTVRGTGEAEIQLKNAITEHSEEGEEIARYTAIETLADTVGDKETAQLARQIRREEERMANFLAKQIPQLMKEVARAEIPASERNGGTRRRRRRTTSRRSTSGRSTSGSTTRGRRTSGRTTSGRTTSGRARRTSSRGGSRSTGTRRGQRSTRSSGARSSRARSRSRSRS
jgi:ferritin-like metal-binding protein YciE